MGNIFLLANLIPLAFTEPICDFSIMIEHASQHDLQIMEQNSINDWESYFNYLANEGIYVNDNSDIKRVSGSDDVSSAITDPESHLNENYKDYYWIMDEDNSALTSDVSNAIPIEMQTTLFPTEDIEAAVIVANVEEYTSYGGCASIASLGILDYFARYLDYKEIINDPTDTNERIILASTLLSHTDFSGFGDVDETLIWPWSCCSAFNEVIKHKGLGNQIVANDQWTLVGGKKSTYWKQIKKNINEGIPVTLCTGMESGNGLFARHYTNIYGYETWVGIPNNGGERLTKQFIKARLNFGESDEYYCDAEILDCAQTALITYKLNYNDSYTFSDSDFANYFVNQSGSGQYFFYNIDTPVTLPNGKIIQTSRLRTSFIENEYLVMSPNRKDAGTAYLDITFPHNISRLSFDSSMWSSLEGAIYESFSVQYFKDGEWIDQKIIDPYELSTLKSEPENFIVLFPKTTNRIRFYATHRKPTGDKNKGRICLDNFDVSY